MHQAQTIRLAFLNYELRLRIKLQPLKPQAKPPRRKLTLNRITCAGTNEYGKKPIYGSGAIHQKIGKPRGIYQSTEGDPL